MQKGFPFPWAVDTTTDPRVQPEGRHTFSAACIELMVKGGYFRWLVVHEIRRGEENGSRTLLSCG